MSGTHEDYRLAQYGSVRTIEANGRFRNFEVQYDMKDGMKQSSQPDGVYPVKAIFNGAGHRVANKAGGVMTIMVYDAGGKIVAEYGATAPTAANLQYVTADYQGSTRVVTNGAGAIANRRDSGPLSRCHSVASESVNRNDRIGISRGLLGWYQYPLVKM